MRQSNKASSAAPPPASEPLIAGPAPGAGSSVAAPAPQPLQGGPYGGMSPMGSISMTGAGYGGSRVDAYGRPPIPSPSSSSQYRGRSFDDHERRPASRSR
jgi:homeobox protein YOX1/YHP1